MSSQTLFIPPRQTGLMAALGGSRSESVRQPATSELEPEDHAGLGGIPSADWTCEVRPESRRAVVPGRDGKKLSEPEH